MNIHQAAYKSVIEGYNNLRVKEKAFKVVDCLEKERGEPCSATRKARPHVGRTIQSN